MTVNQINEQIKHISESGQVSDGYHTFNELYAHRNALSILVFTSGHVVNAFKAKKHHDGTSFDNYFLMSGLVKNSDGVMKQVSYHVPSKFWEYVKLPEYEVSPVEFDGHSSNDVLELFYSLIKTK